LLAGKDRLKLDAILVVKTLVYSKINS